MTSVVAFALVSQALIAAEFVPGQFIVKFKNGVPARAVEALNAQHGANVLTTSPFAGFKVLSVPNGKSVEGMVNAYRRNPNVEYAEPDFIAYAHGLPNDPLYTPYQWHLDDGKVTNPYGGANGGGINVEPAWDITTGAGVIVAVIDTGVAYEDFEEAYQVRKRILYTTYLQAPDLADTSFVTGWDFVNNDSHPNDDEGHGTHVTGTIAQSTNNGIGVAGVAFGCSIMPIKVLGSDGSGSYTAIANGIYFAADNGADVINMSLGGPVGSITLENALAYAYNAGVTIVCSSGNDGSPDTIGYPAAYDDYCIAVGATRYDETVSYYSNGGASLDLTAPSGDTTIDQNGDGYGDGVLQQTHDGSDYTNFGYYFYQGTSMAAPHVSGVAALVLSAGAATTPDEVREALQSTAEDKGVPGWDPAYGYGIVDAYAAVNYQFAPNATPVADAGGPYSGTEDVSVVFDGSDSYDGDGDTLTYRWDFGDGGTGSGLNPTHTYLAGGTYTVTLIVNDGKADSAPATTDVNIEEVNDAPVADAGLDQSVAPGETVNFDGSGSDDIDDAIVSYHWNFGDGSTGSGVTVTHEYSSDGVFNVTLTVTDASGATGEDTAVVTVLTRTITEVHVSGISMDLTKYGANWAATANVTVADPVGNPVPGLVVTGRFDFGTQSLGSSSGITGANGVAAVVSPKVKTKTGTFKFTVTGVTGDGFQWTGGDTLTVSATIQ
jgi:serine protease